MNSTRRKLAKVLIASILTLSAANATAITPAADPVKSDPAASPAQPLSPEAKTVLDRMTAYLNELRSFSIDAKSTRDEVMANGFKLQHHEQSQMVVQFPNKMRVDVSGDLQLRTFVYDGAMLGMYSPEHQVFVRTAAPDSVRKLIGGLLDAGIELPMMDMLYQGANGSLTEAVRGGVLVGETTIDGIACDHLAFRQDNADWQLWVERGDHPLPRKLLITTRNEVGDPQFGATMAWNLKPEITEETFVFSPPPGAREIPFTTPVAITGSAQ